MIRASRSSATVIVTRGPDRLVKNTTTDSAGNYSVLFEEGTGDYLVYVSSTGMRAGATPRAANGH